MYTNQSTGTAKDSEAAKHKDYQWGGGADYPRAKHESFFLPIYFLAGRERSRSMSLQFNYHFRSSLTPPFSLFPPPARVTLRPES